MKKTSRKSDSSKWYKESTPEEMTNLLLSRPYIKTNWKKVAPIARGLNQVLKWNIKDKGFSSITYKFWENLFREDYTLIQIEIESLGLIEIKRNARKGNFTRAGKCRDYRLTELCHRLLADHNKVALYRLLTDKTVKRANQKSISKRGCDKIHYGDVRDEIKATNDSIGFEWNQVEQVIEKYDDEKRAYSYGLLVDIVKQDYKDLKFNSSDGRIWNPYAQLPEELKTIIKLNGLKYQRTIDIRSCYPSLWAEYLSPFDEAIRARGERVKYNKLFLDESKDIKTHLSEVIGIARDEIKTVLVEYFNGQGFTKNMFTRKKKSDPFYKFNQWLKAEFPTLYSVWLTTEIDQTGNNIGKHFETKLMLDKSIYTKAKELGIMIGYIFDGMGLYAESDKNISQLIAYIKSQSLSLLGVSLVFVEEDNAISFMDFMAQSEIERVFTRITENERKLKGMKPKCFATKNWKHYRLLREKTDVLDERLKQLYLQIQKINEES